MEQNQAFGRTPISGRIKQTEHARSEAFEKAENLLDELRPESPLRHRLEQELEELRAMHEADDT